MDDQTQQAFLGGGAEEWLRRIASGGSPMTVPDSIAFALGAIGFAQKTPGGQFTVTDSGKAYLDARGIGHVPTHRDRVSRRR